MSEDNGFEAIDNDPELTEAVRIGLRRAGYHLMRAGSEVLAGISAFLESVGGGADAEDEGPQTQRIEVE